MDISEYNMSRETETHKFIEAVKQAEDVLQCVEKQTEEICIEAVKNNGYTLQYVKERSEVICIEAR